MAEVSPYPPELLILTAMLLGLSLGSFSSVLLHRLPRGESLLFPSSHCPCCEHRLCWYELLPVLSYCLQLGRCRACQVRISARYPLLELTSGLLMALGAALGGPLGAGLVGALLVLAPLLLLRGRPAQQQRGLTLVETLVSIAMVIVLMGFFVDALRVPRQAELMAGRANVVQHLARERLEQVKETAWVLGVGQLTDDEMVTSTGGDSYTVETRVEAFPADSPNPAVRLVKIQVRLGTAAAPPTRHELVETHLSMVIRGQLANEWTY